MSHQFQRHYTREEATALLPKVRIWLARLRELQQSIETFDRRVQSLAANGDDVGGESVNRLIRARTDFVALLSEFREREILIKDLDRGLLDFPAIVAGDEVFLCWEESEPSVEFWHDLETGFAGRQPL